MTSTVSAVIVNYNAGEDLAACVESLESTLRDVDWDAVVVDNASSDDSISAVAGRRRVTLLRNSENVGFARGVNQGVAATTGSLVLVLNPDCRVIAGAAQTLQQELARHPECVAVGPRLLDPDGAVQGSARGDPTMMTGLFGRSSLLGRLFPSSRLAQYNVLTRTARAGGTSSVEVDWVSGACLLARREVLEAVGGFDARYFLYWEDADLCRRLRARGWTIRYVPGATVVHRVGRSSRTAEALAVRAFHESAYRYYSTHVARSALNPARWFARVVLWLRCQWQLMRVGRGPTGRAL